MAEQLLEALTGNSHGGLGLEDGANLLALIAKPQLHRLARTDLIPKYINPSSTGQVLALSSSITTCGMEKLPCER